MSHDDDRVITLTERNLDRAVNLAANGRIDPEQIVATAEKFDLHVKADW